MKGILVLFILIVAGCNSKSSKDNSIDKSAIPLIDSFFKKLETKDTIGAIEHLITSNANINPKDSATLNLKTKFILINEISGPYMGNRLLKKRILGDDIGVYSYLTKYEKKFYRFIFIFYNNGKAVKLYKFLFDDEIDVELEGSLKFYTN